MVSAAAAAALAAWLYLLAAHGRFWRIRNLFLPTGPAGRSRIAVVIPARDESATIGAAVGSLIQQEWVGPVLVCVVDDSSSDATAEIAREAGASVVNAGPLPPGWTGKMWAVSRGLQAIDEFRPDYILLTDADIVHERANIRKLVARAESGGYDLVSLMVRLNCESPAERLLIPAFVFFFFMLYPPAWISRRDRRTAGAAGGCILIRPAALDRIGGIHSIRGDLIDDCALAREVKRTGGSVWLGISAETRSIRSGQGFGDIRRTIARTAFTQLRCSPLLLVGTVAGMLFLYVLPVVAVLRGNIYGAVAWLAMAAAYAPVLRFYRQPWLFTLLLPAAGIFYTAATIDSALKYWTGRGGTWKGRNQARIVRQHGT